MLLPLIVNNFFYCTFRDLSRTEDLVDWRGVIIDENQEAGSNDDVFFIFKF